MRPSQVHPAGTGTVHTLLALGTPQRRVPGWTLGMNPRHEPRDELPLRPLGALPPRPRPCPAPFPPPPRLAQSAAASRGGGRLFPGAALPVPRRGRHGAAVVPLRGAAVGAAPRPPRPRRRRGAAPDPGAGAGGGAGGGAVERGAARRPARAGARVPQPPGRLRGGQRGADGLPGPARPPGAAVPGLPRPLPSPARTVRQHRPRRRGASVGPRGVRGCRGGLGAWPLFLEASRPVNSVPEHVRWRWDGSSGRQAESLSWGAQGGLAESGCVFVRPPPSALSWHGPCRQLLAWLGASSSTCRESCASGKTRVVLADVAVAKALARRLYEHESGMLLELS